MIHEIIFAGFGGQGVLTGGLALAYTALTESKKVTWMPAYGGAMRGGKANSTVKFSDNAQEQTGVPMMEDAEVLVAMNGPALEYYEYCNSDSILLINTDIVDSNVEIPAGAEIINVPCDKIAYSVNNPKGSSLVMLGVAAKAKGWFEYEAYEKGIEAMLAEKGKMDYLDSNIKAFKAGWEYYK